MTDAFGGWLSDLMAGFGTSGSPDSWSGILTSVLAGTAAAVAVAIVMELYLSTGYRTARDLARHGFIVLLALGLFAFAVYDMRHTALGYLGINRSKPAVEFEIRLPPASALAALTTDAQIELHTDRNQTLARVQRRLASTEDGRGLLCGSVPLDFRTTDRTVILSVPGQPQRLFKLRLPANPSRSTTFSPWHLADHVVSPRPQMPLKAPDDTYAIRYRVM